MIKYYKAPDIENLVREISDKLYIRHDLSRIACIKSAGSKSKHTLARCHTISKAIQTGLDIKAHYVIEIISENFDKLSLDDKVKTLIHELMHIPKAFGGGFKGHHYVNKRSVEKMYDEYKLSI